MTKYFDIYKPHVRGTELSAEDRTYALSAFVHRFTRQHVPAWAKEPRPDGSAYKPQFASDQEWLANTLFNTKNGKLNRNIIECYSIPTWPNGQ